MGVPALLLLGPVLGWMSVAPAATAATTTVPCKVCYRGGCDTWSCALGQFCGAGRGTCSATDPSNGSPAYGCNLESTPEAPALVDCPQGFACCSNSGPFAEPRNNLTNYCRNVSAGQFCCGKGFGATPCSTNQRCCGADGGQPLPPGSLCVDVAVPPPPTPYTPQPPWDGPGSCCGGPTTGNLSYVCQAGACCGTAGPRGINDCVNRETQQCCSGKDDPIFPCPGCGFGCSKLQVCGKELGSCAMSGACKRALVAACGLARKTSSSSCFECIDKHPGKFPSCYNKSVADPGSGDFETFCEPSKKRTSK